MKAVNLRPHSVMNKLTLSFLSRTGKDTSLSWNGHTRLRRDALTLIWQMNCWDQLKPIWTMRQTKNLLPGIEVMIQAWNWLIFMMEIRYMCWCRTKQRNAGLKKYRTKYGWNNTAVLKVPWNSCLKNLLFMKLKVLFLTLMTLISFFSYSQTSDMSKMDDEERKVYLERMWSLSGTPMQNGSKRV